MFSDPSFDSSIAWWTPSDSGIPDATQDPSSTLPTSYPDPSLTYSETGTDSEPSETGLPIITAILHSPTLTLAVVSPTSPAHVPLETQVSPADSMRQSSSSAPFTFKTGHKIAISIGVLLVLLAIGGLVVYLRRRPTHQRLYGDSDHDTLNNVGGRGRYRADSFGESMLPRRVLDRSYYNTRLSPLSDDGASSITPLLRTQSESPVLERDQLFSDMSRGSLTILPAAPILRQPRPLPKPRNPRPLVPQRRWNSIQVRMQKKPPLISSFPNATHPLPLSSISIPSSAPSSSSPAQPSSSPTLTSLRNIKPLPPVLDTSLPPLMPQRRTEEKINAAFSSYSPQADLSPATPLRPTPSISSFADTNSTASKTSRHRGLRRKQPHVRNRSGQLELTSESFRCVGERGWNE